MKKTFMTSLTRHPEIEYECAVYMYTCSISISLPSIARQLILTLIISDLRFFSKIILTAAASQESSEVTCVTKPTQSVIFLLNKVMKNFEKNKKIKKSAASDRRHCLTISAEIRSSAVYT